MENLKEKRYFEENEEGVIFFYDSIDDYIVARFLISEGFLREGLIFACMTIEKILKSFIKLKKGFLSNTDWKAHNLLILSNSLENKYGLSLKEYNPFLSRLSNHYKSRYMDNQEGNISKSTSELDELDRLYLTLFEKLPIDHNLKDESKFFQYLNINDSKNPFCMYKDALIKNNDILKEWLRRNNYEIRVC